MGALSICTVGVLDLQLFRDIAHNVDCNELGACATVQYLRLYTRAPCEWKSVLSCPAPLPIKTKPLGPPQSILAFGLGLAAACSGLSVGCGTYILPGILNSKSRNSVQLLGDNA